MADRVNLPAIGTRVRFARDVDRYPFCIVPEGALGTVVKACAGTFAVRLDVAIDDLLEWRNECQWYASAEQWDMIADDLAEVCRHCSEGVDDDGKCGACANCSIPLCLHREGTSETTLALYDTRCDRWGST